MIIDSHVNLHAPQYDDDRAAVAPLLNRPLSDQTAPSATVLHLQRGLEHYLRHHTDILLD